MEDKKLASPEQFRIDTVNALNNILYNEHNIECAFIYETDGASSVIRVNTHAEITEDDCSVWPVSEVPFDCREEALLSTLADKVNGQIKTLLKIQSAIMAHAMTLAYKRSQNNAG